MSITTAALRSSLSGGRRQVNINLRRNSLLSEKKKCEYLFLSVNEPKCITQRKGSERQEIELDRHRGSVVSGQRSCIHTDAGLRGFFQEKDWKMEAK